MLKRSLLTRLVLPLAAFKLALGLAAFFKTYGTPPSYDPYFPYSLYGLLATAFGLTGAVLLLGGTRDRRAQALGGFFLVTATAWCNRPLRLAGGLCPQIEIFSLADVLELDAFMAFFLWTFVHDFPSPPVSLPARRRIEWAARISAAAALLLFGLNLLQYVAQTFQGDSGAAWQALAWFVPQRGQGIYYGVVAASTAAVFPFLIWKARSAQREDQRRARFFLQLLVLTIAPMLLEVLLEFLPIGYRPCTLEHPRLKRAITFAVLMPGLTLPFTVPYAVFRHQVLDIRLMARRALQYALARYSVLTVVTVPLASLCAYFYVNRKETVDTLFSGSRVPLVLSVTAVGVVALRFRHLLLDAIDRRFFREQYDARQILTLLVDRIRSIQEISGLASLVSREIDLALHLEGIALMVLDLRLNMLSDPRNRARKLDATSALTHAISNASDPLEVDLEDTRSPLLKLPEKDRHWLVDSGFRLIVPILARDGALLGIVGLGEKKSGLPFLKEDRQLLHAIASSAAWVLELEQERSQSSSTPPQSWHDPLEIAESAADSPVTAEPAKECPNCGALHPSFTVFCGSCSKRLEKSRVPYVLPGKFRFERRIGVGGMGVVYQGADLALGRQVAIKTLRRVSPEDAMRLRREARTAAAVSHSHLAPVYGMETWQGTPMLILELLEGGTLAQRLFRSKLSSLETIELGLAMAGALGQLHAADILHRDIKPSNIGYTRDGVPKLTDFGIARMMLELREEEEALAELEEGDDDLVPPVAVWTTTGTGLVRRHRFAGTLSYLSPEALRGDPADASFDLWGLAVVLYECLLGQKVFTGTNEQIAERIQAGRMPDFSQVCPEHPPVLGELFRAALHRTRSRRPATAHDLRRRLEEVRELM